MANWFKIIFALLLLCSISFAQEDSGFETSGESTSSYENSENENGDAFGDAQATDSQADSEENVGAATATGDPWEGFHYEEAGLTQWEFQQAKEAGITRDMLTRLVELGVHPSEYLQKPWERLGVTEDVWLKQREQGLEDSDIDRSYRNHSGNQNLAYWSLLIPSIYQWNMNDKITAIWIDALWVVGVGGLTYFAVTADKNEDIWEYWLIPIIGAHLWSFADAFFGTQWENNPDANRFSLGIGPMRNGGVASLMQWRF